MNSHECVLVIIMKSLNCQNTPYVPMTMLLLLTHIGLIAPGSIAGACVGEV